MNNWKRKAVGVCKYANAAFLIFFAMFFLLIPGGTVLHDLGDPGNQSAEIPHSAWRLHRSLTPKYERWARTRLDSTRATELTTENISGTEWPLFGSVFYLWGTESLQDAWDRNHDLAPVPPKEYARGAIEAAAQLVIDPKQANWVKIHWGTNYLKTEDVFYRMLVIAALTSHARLTGDTQYLPMLRDQVESFSAELDASPRGLLNDYPNDCYPGDVLTAIAMIHRADKVLGTDHSLFIERAIRGFQAKAADPRGLVPYSAFATDASPTGPTRGCGNSYVSLFAPEIWPQQARKWYELYTKFFWQEKWMGAGFREFPNDLPGNDWGGDVDAGPVIKGFGIAACAYGVGAARVNGHFEHAFPLTAEMLAASWPLPDGTLLVPQLLSNAADAPYLGESAILFNLTRLPASGVTVKTGGAIPGFVWMVLTLQIGMGLMVVGAVVGSMRRWRKQRDDLVFRWATGQIFLWAGLMAGVAGLLVSGEVAPALLCLVVALVFPRARAKGKIPVHR